MSFHLVIETYNKEFLQKIFNEPIIAEAKPIHLADGVTLKGTEWGFNKGANRPDFATIVITLAIGTASGVAANKVTDWLWGNKAHIERVIIDKTEITLDKHEKIRKIIEEKITKEIE